MSPNISVILCTHNPRPAYLRRCLDALRDQSLSADQWELIVVDNRSLPPVSSLLEMPSSHGVRVVHEDTLGLTPARLRGIRESRGDLLVFVDDDNVLDSNFLEAALSVATDAPHLGAWSGQCRAEFEASPPEWTRGYWGSLVVREFSRDTWSNLPRLAESMPCGAGLCVRRAVALRYLHLHDSGERPFQFDRTGTSLVSGGDNDLAACACDIGLGLGLVARLALTHLIPAERLEQDYLERLIEGIHFSSTLLDAEWGAPGARPNWRTHLKDWLRTTGTKPPHRAMQKAAIRGRNRALRLLASRS